MLYIHFSPLLEADGDTDPWSQVANLHALHRRTRATRLLTLYDIAYNTA